jgi:hypothetical protein
MKDERHFAVHTFLMLSVYMCSAALSTTIVSQYVHVTVLIFNFHVERSESHMFRIISRTITYYTRAILHIFLYVQ